jgi:hypothetical protein
MINHLVISLILKIEINSLATITDADTLLDTKKNVIIIDINDQEHLCYITVLCTSN